MKTKIFLHPVLFAFVMLIGKGTCFSQLVQKVFYNEDICFVTVDSLVYKNKIMWNKTAGVGTVSFNIYKEATPGIYFRIGNVPYSGQPEFVDISSEPEYFTIPFNRISAMDTLCRGKWCLFPPGL